MGHANPMDRHRERRRAFGSIAVRMHDDDTGAVSVPLPDTHSTILVVDDDETWRGALKDWLEQ